MNEILNNESWLREKYITEKYSLKKISSLIGGNTHPNTIKRKLNKLGIKLRNLRESHMVGKEEYFILDYDVLNGTLLGDGCIHDYSISGAPRYSKYSTKEDYAIHVASLLYKLPNDRVSPVTGKTFDGKIKEGYEFRTYTSNLLIPLYNKWYPKSNNYIKIVPDDLVLTPRTILYWFMDDGYSVYINKKKYIVGGLCTESFTKEENEFLCNKLKELGINASVRKNKGIRGTGYRIFLNQTSFPYFFDFIGDCPVDSMKYKWKKINVES